MLEGKFTISIPPVLFRTIQEIAIRRDKTPIEIVKKIFLSGLLLEAASADPSKKVLVVTRGGFADETVASLMWDDLEDYRDKDLGLDFLDE